MEPALRYVVLHHTDIAQPHFDLMVETAPGADLATWRCPHWPARPGDVFEPLGDHRRAYLRYQGPVSNSRGSVQHVETGLCHRRSLPQNAWELHLPGQKLVLNVRK